MHRQLVEQFVQRGNAFLPVNEAGQGDVVRILYADRPTQIEPLQARSFLKHIVAYFGTQPASLRSRYGEVIGKKQLVPLPLNAHLVIVPFCSRIPIGRQSGIGWIVASAITGIVEQNRTQTSIALAADEVLVYHSAAFCVQQMRNARLVRSEYECLHTPAQRVAERLWPYR